MSIRMSCPQCERAYDLADTQRGKTIRCQECQAIIKVEDAAEPVFEQQIFFSGKEMVKSALWLSAWLLLCLAFAIGMPILGYLAITRQGISLQGIIPLCLCVLATIAGMIGVYAGLATLRLFLFSTIPFSSHYLITADRLRRYSRTGKLVEEIPFANIAEVRLVTRRLTEVFGDEADPNIKAKILHIDLRNPEDRNTILDYSFVRWSQQVHHADLALSEDFMDVPIKTVFKKIKKRWEAWQEGPGREADRGPVRARRRPVAWFKKPVVIVSGVLGVVALIGLAGVLAVAIIARDRVAQILNPNQKPIAEGPILKPQQPAAEGAIVKQQKPAQAAPEKPAPEKPAQERPAPATLPGLIAYWPLNEGQGTTTLDDVRKQPALCHGGEWLPGVKGSALRFNGTSDYVDLGDDNRMNFGQGAPFTLAGWVATEANWGPICTFRKAKGFGVIGVLVVKGSLHGWVRDDNSGFGGVQLHGAPIKDGQWHHFALTRQPDGTVELFQDARSKGKAVGKNSGGPITTDLRALASDRFVVASGKNATAYLAGSIDEVRLYDRVLTPGEVGILAGRKE